MAAPVTNNVTQFDTFERVSFVLNAVFDGVDQETDVVKVDVSALENADPTQSWHELLLESVEAEINGAATAKVDIQYDATADQLILSLGEGNTKLSASAGGFLFQPDVLAAGFTGNILFTTANFAAGDTYTIKLTFLKARNLVNVPFVTQVAFSGGDTSPYQTGETIEASITFDKVVHVQGLPTLDLDINTVIRKAEFASGDASKVLKFQYPVTADDIAEATEFDIPVGGLAIGSGKKINGGLGTAAARRTLFNLPTLTGIEVNPIPTVQSVALTGADTSPFFPGETVQVTVTYDKAVTVTGTPQVPITLASGVVQANFVSGSGTTALVFEYVVQTTDEAQAAEFDITGNIGLNGGTIKTVNVTNQDASLVLAASDTSAVTLNDVPQVQAAAFSNNAAGGGTANGWLENDVITLTVTFSEPVDVAGGPPSIDSIALDVGSLTFTHAAGTGTTQLTFTVTIPAAASAQDDGTPDFDLVNGIALNTGTIQDDEGVPNNANVAAVDWSTLVDMSGITVN